MPLPTTETVECDILIIGGGMSGCGAAFEAKYWSRDLKVVLVEKAVIERSTTGARISSRRETFGLAWNCAAKPVATVGWPFTSWPTCLSPQARNIRRRRCFYPSTASASVPIITTVQ